MLNGISKIGRARCHNSFQRMMDRFYTLNRQRITHSGTFYFFHNCNVAWEASEVKHAKCQPSVFDSVGFENELEINLGDE